MSGHSKWSSIKHKKALKDARRGKLFTKLIKEITVAARMGGSDVNANPRLRTAVQTARRRGLALTSLPPMRAATVISLINLVNSFPRRASLRAFLCLIELHLEWPDMGPARRYHKAPGE